LPNFKTKTPANNWANRASYVVVDTHFDMGQRFLQLWQSWCEDPARCQRLHVVVLADKLPSAQALRQAHRGTAHAPLAKQLAQAWPPLTPKLHSLRLAQAV
jgi:tRNA 5-methylaminomethyl-2-thiouridine biosynthesis bifunctional protein